MLSLSMFKQSLKMSLNNIKSNRMRSFLTMLGIIIGVTAVIALVTTVSGVTSYMMERFSSMGAGSITINASGTLLKRGLTENDLQEIEMLENISAISPSVNVRTKVVHNEYISDSVSVSGKSEQYFLHNNSLSYGRVFKDFEMEGNTYICIIDSDCANTFFKGEHSLGKQIKIGGIQYTVIGVCEEDSSLMNAMGGSSGSDGKIYIPYRNALSINGINSVSSLEVYITDTNKTEETIDSLVKILNNTFNGDEDAYSIINMESLLDTMNTLSDMLSTTLAGIAGIALLVGGIGIMNMMLVSVSERTKEIGLRKALGAEPKIIQIQFLTESIILSVFGGIIGIVLGELISYIATLLIGTTFAVNLTAIVLGFGFSFAVGVIFGWMPARNASNLNPIDALRSE